MKTHSTLPKFSSVPSSFQPKTKMILQTQVKTFRYGSFVTLQDVNLPIFENKVTAFIGPSGCGKSTVLRCFNRLNDLVANARLEGEILLRD